MTYGNDFLYTKTADKTYEIRGWRHMQTKNS